MTRKYISLVPDRSCEYDLLKLDFVTQKILCISAWSNRKGFLHATLNIPTIQQFIYLLTDKFFNRCPTHPNPLISSIGNYSLADLHCQYKNTNTNALSTLLFNSHLSIAVFFPLYMFFTAALTFGNRASCI